jgi:hypothetical protein
VALVFRCQRVAGDLLLSAETDDFRWATRDEITKFVTPAYAIRALEAKWPSEPTTASTSSTPAASTALRFDSRNRRGFLRLEHSSRRDD